MILDARRCLEEDPWWRYYICFYQVLFDKAILYRRRRLLWTRKKHGWCIKWMSWRCYIYLVLAGNVDVITNNHQPFANINIHQENEPPPGSPSQRSTPSGISTTASLHQICTASFIISLLSATRQPALTLSVSPPRGRCNRRLPQFVQNRQSSWRPEFVGRVYTPI